MKDDRKIAARRMVRFSMPVLLASMPFLAGCAGGVALPALMAGSYAVADILFLPLRSVVGTVLLNFVIGTG